MEREVSELDTKINEAAAAVASAKNDHEREEGKRRLEELRKQKGDLDRRVREAKEAVEKAEHTRH
jgi:hypothetical protein